MNASHLFRLGVVALSAMCLLAPGLPAIARSPYGFNPPELWFVLLYLFGMYIAVFALCQKLLRALATRALWQRLSASLVIAAGLPFLILVAAVAPFVAVALSLRGQARAAFLPHLSLARKYLEHLLLAPIESHVWLVAPLLVGTLAWLSFRIGAESKLGAKSENAP